MPLIRTLLLGLAALLANAALAATPDISFLSSHALAIDRSGSVFAWGRDSFGQLGTGREVFNATPARVNGLPAVSAMSAGTYHALIVDNAGNVWSWGKNSSSQLGRREETVETKPGRVIGITGVAAVAAGQEFSLALKSDGTVWVWGALNYFIVDGFKSAVPIKIPGLSGIVKLVAGDSHLLALKADGTVLAMGMGYAGQVGDGAIGGTPRTTPYLLPGVTGVVEIAAGYSQSLARKSDGTVLAWGTHAFSNLRLTPQLVQGLTGAVSLAAHHYESFAAKSDGTVVTWDDTYSPTQVPGFSAATQVTAADGTVFAMTSASTVQARGRNFVGQRGLGHTDGVDNTTTAVPGLPSVSQVAAGRYYAMARTSTGALYVWGINALGELGSGGVTSRSVPKTVQGLPSGIIAVDAGVEYSLALASDGRVWAWGNISIGAPFSPVGTPARVPTLIPGRNDVVQISAGGIGALLRLANGQVVFYPAAGAGALGTIGQYDPMSSLSNIVSVNAGYGDFFAIRNDGALLAWGQNTFGELGDGTTTVRQTPVQIGGITGQVTQVAAAQGHTLARTADGRVWAWGRNNAGQIGDGTTVSRLTPVQVPGLTNVVAVQVGAEHSVALLADGTVRAWGENGFGQLGDGTTTRRLTPVTVLLDKVSRIAAGGQTITFAMRQDGTVWGWGGYANGDFPRPAIGDGTYAIRVKPVLVLREEEGNGNLDGANKWYMDLDPQAADEVPASALKGIVPVTQVRGGDDSLGLAAGINYRQSDYGKTVGTYVMALVPPAFLSQVKLSPELPATEIKRLEKAGGLVFVQLTPQGWTTVNGQLVAFAVGTAAASTAAASILDNIRTTAVPGARFCIGYGESPGSMLASSAVADILTLEGAATTTDGLPCLLSGVYVSGPASSASGSSVTFNATVVGASPSGSLQFKDGLSALGGAATLASSNAAVATASLTTSTLSTGSHSIGAAYSGDPQNVAAVAELPLLHSVVALTAGTVTSLSGPSSSQLGLPVAFTATITGKAPSGTVQLKDGTNAVGPPVAVYNGTASFTTAELGTGSHTLTAVYSGDASNAASTSASLSHTVYETVTTTVSLTSSANPHTRPAALTLTAVVTGSSPMGSVQFFDGATLLGTVNLVGGVAQLTTSSLEAGWHEIRATYSGDGSNQISTSSTLFQQVQLGNPVVPPGSPTIGVASLSGNTAASVSFTAPSSNGGAAITTYTVTSNPGGITASGTSSPILVSGLSRGMTYRFTVAAANSAGYGPASAASNPVATPAPTTVPGAPSVTSVSAGDGRITVGFSAPSSDGGSPITGYSAACGSVTAAGATSPIVVTGLVNGVAYTCTVVATNAVGTGPASAPSGSVTPDATVTIQLPTLAPAALDFGGQSMMTTRTLQIVVTNPNSSTLTVSSVTANAGFKVATDCTTVAAGAACTANVSFTPAIEGSASGVLTIVTSAGNKTAPLTGAGEKSLVSHYYRSILGRAPDAGGKAFWESEAARVSALGANINETWFALALTFYTSSEYAGLNRNPTEYVRDLYNTFFNRAADSDGLAYWTGQIAQGLPREVVLVAFMFSTEFTNFAQAIFGNTAARAEVDTVVDFYRGLLTRLPDSSGFNYWVGEFRKAQCKGAPEVYAQVEAISSAYANGTEYSARNRSNTQYMADIYNAFLRRGGDLDGVKYWISQLDTGARTRDNVRRAFIASPEFSARVSNIISQGCLG